MIFITRGIATMGRTTHDAEGNIIKSTPAKFETDDNGPVVAIGEIDEETMKVKEPITELFGDWDAAQYLERVLELLNPGRKPNLPPLKDIVVTAARNGECPFIDYCPNDICGDCVVREWVEEVEG